jgi:hypothetical protein
MNRRVLTRAVLSLSLFVAACSGSVAETAEDLCTSLEALHDTMEQVAGADVSTDTVTIESLQNAVSEVETAVQDVQGAESDLSDSLKTQLREDFEELQSSIQDIPADSALAEAGDAVVAATTEFKASWDQTLSELNCEAT